MTLWDVVKPEVERIKAEEQRQEDERVEAKRRILRQALNEVTVDYKAKNFRKAFGEENWKIVDLKPEIDRYGRGQCRPDIIVTDSNLTVYLALTRNCNVLHWNIAYHVTVSTGPCHWRLDLERDDPDAAYIAAHLSEKPTPEHRWRVTAEMRERPGSRIAT